MTSKLERRPNLLLQKTAAAEGDRNTWRTGVGSMAGRLHQPKRIGLFGLFGSGNSGNDASLEAMVGFLRQVRPDAELVCFCACSAGADDVVTRTLDLPAIPFALARPKAGLLRILDRFSLQVPRQLASLVRALVQMRRLEVLIIPGTGILDDFQESPLGMPLVLFGWCLAAKLCRARIAFVSIGAGPIEHPLSRWLMTSAIAMADYRSYRDTGSRAFMERIGFDTRNDAVYPDIAFKVPEPSLPPRHDADRPLAVGVGVMSYHGWRTDRCRGAAIYETYIAKISQFVLWLLDQGHAVRILMGAEGDRQAMADLVARVAAATPGVPQNRLHADPVHSLHELMQQIAETDMVVATRFHNIVSALKLRKPTVSLGYAQKNDLLMAEMGLGGFCQHIEDLDLRLLFEQFEQLRANRKQYEERLREANHVCQGRLKHQDLLVASTLLGHIRSPVGRAVEEERQAV